MPNFAERLSSLLSEYDCLDDDQIAARLGVARQQVNQTARRLQARGLIRRQPGPQGKIVNCLGDAVSQTPAAPSPRTTSLLSEDEVKLAVRDHLEAQGYRVTVMWGGARGIDIEALRGDERLVIEAKGEVASDQQQGNYFLGALGELVQRMSDEDAQYGLALPDNRRYRGLAARLPELARRRLRLIVYFVRREGAGFAVEEGRR